MATAIAAALIGAFLAGAAIYLMQTAKVQSAQAKVTEAEKVAQTARAQVAGLQERLLELEDQVKQAERRNKRERTEVERADAQARNARQADSGTGDLADGRWFGFISEVSSTPDEVTFDVAQYFTGEAANKAAEQDGAESPVPNDVYIRNESRDERVLPVAGSVKVSILEGNGAQLETVTYKQFVGLYQTATKDEKHLHRNGYWLTLDGGEVTSIEEQYHP